MIVLLDTNFLTIPSKFHIDIFSEIEDIVLKPEFTTIEQVIDELKKIRGKKAGKLALELVKKFKVKIVYEEGKTDDALIKYALEKKAVIATNDKELRKKCIGKKIPVIFMRKKKILEMR